MKKLLVAIFLLLTAGVATAQSNNVVLHNYHATTAFTIPEKDLIPECITYDAKTASYFVGSLYKRKIIAIPAKGEMGDFIQPGQDGLCSVLGIKGDESNRLLWVLACNTPFIRTDINTYNENYTTAVFKYNIDTKQLVKCYTLTDTAVFFNDIVITGSGDAFITDTYSGSIYTISHAKDTLQEYLPKKSFVYPNGISAWKNSLFVASEDGVTLVNLGDKQQQVIKVNSEDTIGGIDGLYFYNNGLVGVQNSTAVKSIIKINLDTTLTAVTKIERLYAAKSPSNYYSPTTGVIVNNRFYFIYNAQARSFDKDGKIFPMNKLQPVLIKKIDL